MKKILSIFSVAFAVALALQSCNRPAADPAKEMAMIDSAAGVRLQAYRDSLDMICMNQIMVLAQAKADSMMTAAMKKTAPGSKPKPKPTSVPNPDKPTVTNRPGTNEASQPTITNRPGTNEAAKPTISNRPGATNQPATVTPPKF